MLSYYKKSTDGECFFLIYLCTPFDSGAEEAGKGQSGQCIRIGSRNCHDTTRRRLRRSDSTLRRAARIPRTFASQDSFDIGSTQFNWFGAVLHNQHNLSISTSRENCSATCPLSIRDGSTKVNPANPSPSIQGGFIRRVHFDKAAKVQAEKHPRPSLLQNGSQQEQASLATAWVGHR